MPSAFTAAGVAVQAGPGEPEHAPMACVKLKVSEELLRAVLRLGDERRIVSARLNPPTYTVDFDVMDPAALAAAVEMEPVYTRLDVDCRYDPCHLVEIRYRLADGTWTTLREVPHGR